MRAVPFNQLGVDDLEDVLSAQLEEWRVRLDWDLTDITNLIRDSFRARSLRGSALMDGDRAIGLGFFVWEPERCLIGDVYVGPEHRKPAANAILAEGLLAQIFRRRSRHRIESQSVCFDMAGLDDVFARNGFAVHSRHYLRSVLSDLDDAAAEHPRVHLRAWRDADFDVASEVIYQAYRGSVDARLNSQYRTRDGCVDLLDALTASPWCGRFEPELTQIAEDRATGRVCGIAVGSAISARAAHLGQISVLPIYQGERIGRFLVRGAQAAARLKGYETVSLAVTESNAGALHLYESCGFLRRLAFPVFCRE